MSDELSNKQTQDRKKISKIANIEVTMQAELGHATLNLKNAIEYDSGSVVVLDKAVDEPVEITVNDILIAKGQIVAVDDSYGVKIVEIVENHGLEKKENV